MEGERAERGVFDPREGGQVMTREREGDREEECMS